MIETLKEEIQERNRQLRSPETLISNLFEVDPEFRELILFTKHSIDQINQLLSCIEAYKRKNCSLEETVLVQSRKIMKLEQDLWADHTKAQDLLDQKNDEMEEIASKMEQISKDSEGLMEAYEDLKKNHEGLATAYREMESAYSQCLQRVELLEEQERNTKGIQTEEGNNEKERLQEKAKEMEKYIQELQKEQERSFKEREESQKDIKELKELVKKSKENEQKVLREASMAQNDLQKAKEEVARLKKDNESLLKRANEPKTDFKELQMGDLGESPLMSGTKWSEQEEEITRLKKKLKAEEDKVKILGAVVQRMTLETQDLLQKEEKNNGETLETQNEKGEEKESFASSQKEASVYSEKDDYLNCHGEKDPSVKSEKASSHHSEGKLEMLPPIEEKNDSVHSELLFVSKFEENDEEN